MEHLNKLPLGADYSKVQQAEILRNELRAACLAQLSPATVFGTKVYALREKEPRTDIERQYIVLPAAMVSAKIEL